MVRSDDPSVRETMVMEQYEMIKLPPLPAHPRAAFGDSWGQMEGMAISAYARAYGALVREAAAKSILPADDEMNFASRLRQNIAQEIRALRIDGEE
jgi:hypothetical protein